MEACRATCRLHRGPIRVRLAIVRVHRTKYDPGAMLAACWALGIAVLLCSVRLQRFVPEWDVTGGELGKDGWCGDVTSLPTMYCYGLVMSSGTSYAKNFGEKISVSLI